jgi:hypothetical protein
MVIATTKYITAKANVKAVALYSTGSQSVVLYRAGKSKCVPKQQMSECIRLLIDFQIGVLQ